MIIKLDRSGTVEGFVKLCGELQEEHSVKSLLILSCDANEFAPENIDSELKKIPLLLSLQEPRASLCVP